MPKNKTLAEIHYNLLGTKLLVECRVTNQHTYLFEHRAETYGEAHDQVIKLVRETLQDTARNCTIGEIIQEEEGND